MTKRIIISLAVAFILAILLSFGINNRIYAEEPAGEVLSDLADNEYTTLEDFKAGFLSELHNHNENIVIRLRGTALTHPDISAIISEALDHNIDDPKGGDYIMQNITGGYNYHFEVGEDENGVYTELTFTTSFFTDAEMEREVDEAVAELLLDLDLSDKSDYQKIKAVYNWMTENIVYDWDWDDETFDTSYHHSTHAAIVSKKAVCQGIASLFYRLMLELDIDCRVITGDAGDERHAWNIVQLNGVYYNMDATWDLGLSDHYRCFLLTDSSFAEHDRDAYYETDEFNASYPMATLPYVEHVAASGSVNANIYWVLDADTGTLTISGKGAIPSYRFSEPPWYSYRTNVSRIVIEEGITEVGERSLYWCVNCTEVQLPTTLIAIREYGFNSLQSLEQITLPENLKIIEFCAFSECLALKSIVLPDSVTTVGPNTFSNCENLTSATLSAGMREVPDSMFGGDPKLSHVVIPEGITHISDTAFIMCGFTEFNIPSTVTGIGVASFSGCSKLTKITVADDNPVYKDVDGVLFSKDGKHLICYPAAKTGSRYYIPEGTVVVDYGAFRGQSKLYSVTFPSSLVEIEGYAFSYCTKLDGLVFPETLRTIGTDAFRSCTLLASVTFNNPDVELVGYTFAACSRLKSIDLPANLKAIPNGLFFGCKALESIEIPKTVTSIGSSAFIDCDLLTDVVIPGNVKSIGQQAFDFCQLLSSITFEEGVTTLDWIAARNAPNLSEVHLPASLRSIGKENFDNCPKLYVYVDCRSAGYSYVVNNGIRYRATHTYIPLSSYPSTCTQNGYTLYGCRCGYLDGYRDDFLPFAEHTYVSNTTPPTCTEQGYTTHTCSVCGDYYTNNYVDATGHNYDKGVCTICGAEHPNLANYEGKVISILGDSISTFVGYIPKADGFNREHLARYPQDNLLTDVNETWWMQIIDVLNAKLGINDSWRGATFSGAVPVTTGDTGENAALSNLQRIQNLGSNGTPDVIMVYGGTNDLAHVSKIGTFDPSVAPTTVDLTTAKWDNLADGFLHTILRIRYYYPDAQIIVMLPTYTASYYSNEKLARGNEIMAAICDYYGVAYTDLRESGVTADLLPDGIHPGEQGMDLITDAVLEALLNECEVEPGENVVHSVEHILSGAESSLGYYNGVSDGKPFISQISGEDLSVKVTMCGVDITASVYADGRISIPSVSGNIVIIAKGKIKPIYDDYLQHLPENFCTDTNLWNLLEHDRQYYTVDGWGVHASGHVYSVTIPVCAGDRLWATSFQKSGLNGGTINGIRLTWFDETGVIKSLSADETYAEFNTYGYLSAPEGAMAVNVVMWTGDDSNELYILNAPHNYETVITPPTCTEQGYTTYTCHCGNSYVDDYTDALGHNLGAWNTTTPATCTEDGSGRRDCTRCDHYETSIIPKTGHTYTTVVTPPPCTDQGYTTYICHCGDSYVDNYTEALGHAWNGGEIIRHPTVSSAGEMLYTCTVCGAEERKEIPVLEYETGDVNGEGGVNSGDAVYLLMHTFFPEEYPINQNGDFDNSGRVDSADAIYLLMYTFFPDEYPLPEPIRVTVEVSGRRKEDE